MTTGTRYSIDLLHPARDETLLTLDDFEVLDVAQRENEVGAWRLDLPWEVAVGTAGERQRLTFSFLDALLDARVVVWRRPVGGHKAIQCAGFVRYWKPYVSGPQRFITLQGPDYNDILARRLIAAAAGAAGSDKSGATDTVMRAYVDENLGSSAAAARDMTDYGFSVAAAAGTGTTISKSASYRGLLPTLQELHEQSRNTMSTAVWFGVVPTGTGWEMEFRMKAARWGQDHRSQVGTAPPVVFSLQNKNMVNPSLSNDYRDEITLAYGRGRGEGEERDPATTATDSTRRNRSALNRREAYFDGRSYEKGSTALERATREVLEGGRPLRQLLFDVQDTDACIFGRHWGFGDQVTAQFMEYRADMRVTAYRIRVQGNEERIQASLEED